MDLGCLDMGCISVQEKADPVVDSENKEGVRAEFTTSASKPGKNKLLKESSQSTNVLNKFTSQIRKPPHRKASPINWFPRKKVESYLKRKIKMLQEVDGMNLSLDETLGDANPHYCRVLREKIAAREAVHRAMEARKAAMVEASWCRILRAARIQSKEADLLLQTAEKNATEAFEAATAMGVIMYDIPNCPSKSTKIQTSSGQGGEATTHTVTASFETPFEVDREVAAAVRSAFIRLANCPSFSKDEFKDLLQKISQKPDTGENNDHELSASDFETASQKSPRMLIEGSRQRKNKRRQSLEKLTMTKLVDMMIERLKCLQEDELSSLATIVATCGLNAALAEIENNKMHDPGAVADCNDTSSTITFSRISSLGAGSSKTDSFHTLQLPSLDKYLVKHMTKLEMEVEKVRSRTKPGNELAESEKEKKKNPREDSESNRDDAVFSGIVPDLGSVLINKHSSKLEKEIEEAKRYHGKGYEATRKKGQSEKGDVSEVPSLDKVLVKHVSRLEREVQEAKNRKNNGTVDRDKENASANETEKEDVETSLDKILVKPVHRLEREKARALISGGDTAYQKHPKKQGGDNAGDCESLDKVLVKHVSRLEREVQEAKNRRNNGTVDRDKENVSANETGKEDVETSLDKILVKPVHRLEREKARALISGGDTAYQKHPKKQGGDNAGDLESLDKVLVKHVSRLEKEKMRVVSEQQSHHPKAKRSEAIMDAGLDQVLVKHKSRLQREKIVAAATQPEEQMKISASRKEARERELQEAWGGLSLGNSMKPHLSRLEQEKAAWIKAEQEERRQVLQEL